MSSGSFDAQKFNAVKSGLSTRHGIKVPDEWLKSSLQSMGAFAGSNINAIHIFRKWQNIDIQTLGSTVSPFPPLNAEGKITIPGVYQMQINLISDVSRPDFENSNDFLDIEEEDTEGFDDDRLSTARGKIKKIEGPKKEVKKKEKAPRLLKLILTDGVQEVQAIEYHRIEALTSDLPLGCKVLIKGPFDAHFGVLHLRPNNVEILGGEVESLKKKRPNSSSDFIGSSIARAFVSSHQVSSTGPASGSRQSNTFHATTSNVTNFRPQSAQSASDADQFNDDCFDDDMDQVIASIPFDESLFGTSARDKEAEGGQMEAVTLDHTQGLRGEEGEEGVIWVEDDDEDEGGIGDEEKMNDEETLDLESEWQQQSEALRVNLWNNNSAPFTYISQIKSEMPFSGKRSFVIKVIVLKTVGKLNVAKYRMRVNVTDGISELEVDVSSSVLEKLTSVSHEEFKSLKQRSQQDDAVKRQVLDILRSLARLLQDFSCLMRVEFEPNADPTQESIPVATDCFQIDDNHLVQLTGRATKRN